MIWALTAFAAFNGMAADPPPSAERLKEIRQGDPLTLEELKEISQRAGRSFQGASSVVVTQLPFRDCPKCPEMLLVPASSYRVGSRRDDDEGRPREVTFRAPFALGAHEVTVAEFGRFVDETGYSAGSSCRTYEGGRQKERTGRGWRNPGFGQSGEHPAACVNWNDAQAYAAWLSRKTGERYRLPSESEWEHAAHAGKYLGEDGESGQCRHANSADASAAERYSGLTVASCRDGHVHTAPVGSLVANSWGLHDMLGNVWEWTQDCWNGRSQGAPSDGSAWESGNCAERVLRGGSWLDLPSDLRAGLRIGIASGDRSDSVGFRLARALPNWPTLDGGQTDAGRRRSGYPALPVPAGARSAPLEHPPLRTSRGRP